MQMSVLFPYDWIKDICEGLLSLLYLSFGNICILMHLNVTSVPIWRNKGHFWENLVTVIFLLLVTFAYQCMQMSFFFPHDGIKDICKGLLSLLYF